MPVAFLWLLLATFHVADQPSSHQASSTPRAQVGRIVDNSYENDFLGFRYEFPEHWRVHTLGRESDAPEEDTNREVYLLASFQTPTFPRPLGQIDIRIVNLSRSPLSEKDRILPDESPRERNPDLKRKRGPSTVLISGRQFTRTDFEMRWRGVTVLYETKLTTEVSDYALVFTLMADDRKMLEEILRTTEGLRFVEKTGP